MITEHGDRIEIGTGIGESTVWYIKDRNCNEARPRVTIGEARHLIAVLTLAIERQEAIHYAKERQQ
jgi:hypothetical protein